MLGTLYTCLVLCLCLQASIGFTVLGKLKTDVPFLGILDLGLKVVFLTISLAFLKPTSLTRRVVCSTCMVSMLIGC